MSAPDEARATRHRRLGWALAGILIVDLAWFRAASEGREAAMRISPAPSASWVLPVALVVATVLLAHGALGVTRALREPSVFAYGDRDRRRLQWITAFVFVPFLVVRAAYGPLALPFRDLDGLGLHRRMTEELGQPWLVVVQTLGVATLGLHVFQGLSAHARITGRAWLVPLGLLLAASYALVFLDTLAAFVVGRTLLPRF